MVNVLEWSNVSLTLKVRDRKSRQTISKKLLLNQSGRVYGSQLLAIMGPTGCGKTSLMNVLSGKVEYNKKLKLVGNIHYNGQFMDHGLSMGSVAYVGQNERVFAFLTVRETLMIAAYFHSNSDTPKEGLEEKVDTAIRELSLTKAADTILGNDIRRGVSGGEYQRVLIGKELIKNPNIIFLDEPTSGLDSFQALSVMETMKALTIRGRIVVAVIHQPRSSIYALFDRLLLLSEGRLMFFGDAKDALQYFEGLGFHCPSLFNPADYFLDILSIETKTIEMEESSLNRVDAFAKAWQNYEKSRDDVYKVELSSSKRLLESATLENIDPPKKPWSTWFTDFAVLTDRAFKDLFRNYTALIVRCCTTLFFAVLVSLIYRNLGHDQRSIQNRAGLLYFVLVNQGFAPLVNALATFPAEKQIVSREVGGGSYRLSSYYVARVLAELPTQIIFAFVYCTIIYWSTGLYPDAVRFFLFTIIIILTTLCSAALGFSVSSISPNAAIANAIGPPIFIILLLYGGFYINASSLPPGSIWVRNLSNVYWGFQALVVNEFTGLTFTCNAAATGSTCITTGEQEITNLAFANAKVGLSGGVLVILAAGFFVMGYFGLVISRKRYCRIKPPDEADSTVNNASAQQGGRGREGDEMNEEGTKEQLAIAAQEYNHRMEAMEEGDGGGALARAPIASPATKSKGNSHHANHNGNSKGGGGGIEMMHRADSTNSHSPTRAESKRSPSGASDTSVGGIPQSSSQRERERINERRTTAEGNAALPGGAGYNLGLLI